VKHLKDVFFSKGSRASLVFPQNVDFSSRADELHRGRYGLHLSFDLSKGLYATILVKRITNVAGGGSPPQGRVGA
jgi:tRNA pseudouridine13 synthase